MSGEGDFSPTTSMFSWSRRGQARSILVFLLWYHHCQEASATHDSSFFEETLQFTMMGSPSRGGVASFVHLMGTGRQMRRYTKSSRRLSKGGDNDCRPVITNVAIVGGGLAGLSVAYHLLDQKTGAMNISIYDKANLGEGGASSVAGG